jgi:imidazole glycerol phosphate synthase subunit HisF
MHFQSLTLLSLVALSAALPASLQIRQAGVLKATTFNDISIAGGVAGNAEAEAAAAFSALNLNDLTSISKADQDFLDTVNQVANDAEKEAFNPAVEAATGDAAAAVQVRLATWMR